MCDDDGTAYGPCVCGSNGDAGPSDDATVADASAGDVSRGDDAPSDGEIGDGVASDASDAGNFGTPTVVCSFTVASPYDQVVTAVAEGPRGAIAAVGQFNNPADAGALNLGDGTPLSVPDGSWVGGFVTLLDASCKIVWARAIEFATGVAFDSAGNIWALSTRYPGLVSILTKFDPLGNVLLQTAFGSASDFVGIERLAIDPTDSVVITGEYAHSPSLGGPPLPDVVMGMFAAKLDPFGRHVWSKGFGGVLKCQRTPQALAVDPAGNLLLGGIFGGGNAGCDLSFGGPQLTSSFGGFVARLGGADGSHLWSFAWDGAEVAGACVTESGSIFAIGTVTAPFDFGSGTIVPPTQYGVGFVARLAADGGSSWGRPVSVPKWPGIDLRQVVCGGAVGERALMTGLLDTQPATGTGTTFLQVAERDGGEGWTYVTSGPEGPASIASGSNRDIVFGSSLGANFTTDHDVYVLRLTR